MAALTFEDFSKWKQMGSPKNPDGSNDYSSLSSVWYDKEEQAKGYHSPNNDTYATHDAWKASPIVENQGPTVPISEQKKPSNPAPSNSGHPKATWSDKSVPGMNVWVAAPGTKTSQYRTDIRDAETNAPVYDPNHTYINKTTYTDPDEKGFSFIKDGGITAEVSSDAELRSLGASEFSRVTEMPKMYSLAESNKRTAASRMAGEAVDDMKGLFEDAGLLSTGTSSGSGFGSGSSRFSRGDDQYNQYDPDLSRWGFKPAVGGAYYR